MTCVAINLIAAYARTTGARALKRLRIRRKLHFRLKNQPGVLAQRVELDLRPLLLDGAQGGAVVHQQRRCIDGVERDAVRVGVHEFFQLLRVITRHPARQIEVAGHDAGLDAVLMLEPVRDDFKLQLTHGAQQQQ